LVAIGHGHLGALLIGRYVAHAAMPAGATAEDWNGDGAPTLI
jgi:hypothetical protein